MIKYVLFIAALLSVAGCRADECTLPDGYEIITNGESYKFTSPIFFGLVHIKSYLDYGSIESATCIAEEVQKLIDEGGNESGSWVKVK